MEYNFKDIYKSFNISYFSKNKDLLNDFADDNLLKNYESIDYVNKKVMVILIKRFKLRISFSRTSNFSNEFIISDDYDFNPTLLNFSSNLLKIAVVKNNIDKWMNSKNLYNYDYIFAIEDYVNDLNEYEVLKINDGTVYDEIKFILNELYRKRFEKFNYFIKNTGFDIFPNQKDYFKVLNSEYFADQWYRDMYSISDNTDCVIHFLLVGSDKGYNPGPDFSTFEYYESNKDVKKAGMNALIHYEKYGRKENRLMRISDKNQRDYEVILNSPLFDKGWYERTYDIGEDIDSINHYLLTGYAKGYNPGPDFSTHEYYECNKDVKEDKENPLVHYELFGRKEKRKFKFSDEDIQANYELISNSPLFDKDWYESSYNDVGDEIDPVFHYLNIGYAKGYDPGPDFSTFEYYECNKDVRKYGMNALIHYEKYGRKENRFIWISDKNLRDYELILNSSLFDKDWYERTYDIGEDIDSINHYLLTGYAKGYNPGPDFSTFEYYECNKDVKESNENPLVHYELFGRKEKRKTHFSNEQHRIEYNIILNSEYFDKEWYESSYDIGRNVDSVFHYLNIGYAKGYDPGPDFSTKDYYRANKDVEESGINPLLHYERYGRREQRKLSFKD